MARKLVIDSNNYHPITAAELRSVRASGLLCNATEGTVYRNPILADQRKAAKDAGVPFGSYLFLHPDSTGSEAEFYLKYAKPKKGDFPPIVDAEVTNLGLPELAHRVASCAGALKHEGYKPMLYAGYEVWDACVKEYPWLKELDLWFPQYPGPTRWSPSLDRQRIRLKGAKLAMWQFTDAFAIHGKTFDASVTYKPIESLLIQ